jgi:arylsulfatase A-like enzyme
VPFHRGLPAEERTLAQALKAAGYRTAFVGNWLLGHALPEYWPGKRGFDSFYGSLSGQVEPQLRKAAKADWYRNERPLKEEGYVTDLLAREAARIIAAHDPSGPLLLMVAFNTPAQFHGIPRTALDQYRDVPDDTRRATPRRHRPRCRRGHDRGRAREAWNAGRHAAGVPER